MRKYSIQTAFFAFCLLHVVLYTVVNVGAAEDDPNTQSVFNVRSFGAVGDGTHLDTRAIQAAVDACSKAGGGRVFVPPGRYLIGTLVLKNNVDLHLSAASIRGRLMPVQSPAPAEFSFHRAGI
jgi:hypothetical protein